MKMIFWNFKLCAAWSAIILVLLSYRSMAQEPTPANHPYSINKKIEIPLTLGLFATNYLGLQYVGNIPGLDSLDIVALNTDHLWGIDRKALTQNASFAAQAHHISDWGLNISVALPALLMFDKNIKSDWFDLLVLYGETHAINGNLYILAASTVKRPRPLVYNPEVDFQKRQENGTLNAFFSGHVSTAAASSFFAAKVYSDYHPELGNKKYIFFGAALLPPLFVGYYRFKALKHFPTDVITGLSIGAVSGILVPQLHKQQRAKGLSVVPFSGDYAGCMVRYRF